MNKLMHLSLFVVMAIAIISQSSCQSAVVSSIDNLKAQFLPAEYRNMNFTIDDLKKVYREKCKKVTGVDNSTLYQEIEKSAATLVGCLTGLANFTAIQEEVDFARPIGELDTVFHKHCAKAPQAESCLRNFNLKLQPCLSAEEKKQNAVVARVATSLLGFLCAKGGDQIALFVAEDGPECLEANKEAISNCLNSSFAELIPQDAKMPDLLSLPEMLLKPEHCVDLEKFEKCTVHHLEQCHEITPANVAESVFKFIKNETSCKNWIDDKRSILIDPKSAGSAAVTLSSHFGALASICAALLVMRMRILL